MSYILESRNNVVYVRMPLILLSFLILIPFPVQAADGKVTLACRSNQRNYATIQAAVNAAPNTGCSILLGSKSYAENLTINKSLKISGVNQKPVVISGSRIDPVMHINSAQADITLSNLVITNGYSSTIGGGIRVDAVKKLIIENSRIERNKAIRDGGGLFVASAEKLTLQNTTISNNISQRSGGGVRAEATGILRLYNSKLYKNRASTSGGGLSMFQVQQFEIDDSALMSNFGGFGGGLHSVDSSGIIDASIISDNVSVSSGAGIYAIPAGSKTDLFVLNNSIVANNNMTGSGDGGGVYLANILIHGVKPASKVQISLSRILTNSSSRMGGGLYIDLIQIPVRIEKTALNGNQAQNHGGGIYKKNSGDLQIHQTAITRNITGSGGGGVYASGGELELINSTVSRNRGFTDSALTLGHTMGKHIIMHSTIVENISASLVSDLAFNIPPGVETVLHGNIISGSCRYESLSPYPPVLDETYNLISPQTQTENSCYHLNLGEGPGSIIGDPDSDLGPLQNNGGPTETHALDRFSQATSTIPTDECPTKDQRGTLRPTHNAFQCDMGAYEQTD